jgi:type IV secretory pathway VirB2 component (pilin)
MKVLREIYDFITGGSIAAPAGLAVAIVGVILMGGRASSAAPYVFVAIVVLTLAAASREKVA